MKRCGPDMDAWALSLWIVVAVFPLSNAITCSETAQCEYDSLVFSTAQVKGEVARQCSLLDNSLECLESAVEDCRVSINVPKEKVNEAQHLLETRRQQVLTHCPVSDQLSAKATGTQRPWGNPSQKINGPADIPKKPLCTDIMACMFDLGQFKSALRNNRLTEACSLINPSVRCLRVAIKDCKDNQLIDSEDMTNATHSLTDAEKLLETYCGYTRDKDDPQPASHPESTETRQGGDQTRNEGQSETKSQEQSFESKTNKNSQGGYETLKEDQKSGTGYSGNTQSGSHNTATRAMYCPFLFLAFFLIFTV